ncbi:MAG: glycosyltransferase family 4 protein, partial [Planctomycetota bacterium]
GGNPDAETAGPAQPTPLATSIEPAANAGNGSGRDVFMLGWEFPPFISGGLGTACYGLTQAMSKDGHRILFVIPGPLTTGFSAEVYRKQMTTGRDESPAASMSLPDFDNVEFHGLGTGITGPYMRPFEAPPQLSREPRMPQVERADIFEELPRFNDLAADLAQAEKSRGRRFEIVHAHDWLTFEAAHAAAAELGVPTVLHVHSTELDRTPTPSKAILEAERAGLHLADHVICVSRYTAQTVVDQYDVPASKITIIHNASDDRHVGSSTTIGSGEPVVLFVGRLDKSKGIDTFLRAASRVAATQPGVRFVIAGGGPMQTRVRQLIDEAGLSDRVLLAGHLDEKALADLYDAANLLVMPSPSEPFGLAALEALRSGVPTLVSKTSGVTEATA